jgi:cell division protein FtsB
MPENDAYGDFYERGSTARKKAYLETPEQKNNIKRRYGKNKKRAQQKANQAENRALIMISIIFVFSMIMLITYRYNVISEKNLVTQNLKSELETAESNLLAAKIAVEQDTNLDYIEAYAKQKLGMQKPTSSQTIYVDTSNITQVVEVNENLSVIENIVNKVKETLISIF